jgi:hypothetical protein
VTGAVLFHEVFKRTVGITDTDDILTGLNNAEDSCGSGSHAGSKSKSRNAMFQSSNFILKDTYSRILNASVNVSMLVMHLRVIIVIDLMENVQRIHEDRGDNGVVILLVFFSIMRRDHFRTAEVKILIHISFILSVPVSAAEFYCTNPKKIGVSDVRAAKMILQTDYIQGIIPVI